MKRGNQKKSDMALDFNYENSYRKIFTIELYISI